MLKSGNENITSNEIEVEIFKMALSGIKQDFKNSKKDAERYKRSFDMVITLSTLIAVISPILIAQTSNFFIRLTGASFLLCNILIGIQADIIFSKWLGLQKKYSLMKLEFLKYQTSAEEYGGLNEQMKEEVLQQKTSEISKDILKTLNILGLTLLKIRDIIKEQKPKVTEINERLGEIIEVFRKKYQEVSQERFIYYIKYRYLDQLNWYYKRIDSDQKSLRKKDIKKSVYFNFRKNYIYSTTFSIISFGITVFTARGLLTLLGVTNITEIIIFLVFSATVFSIVASMYNEIDIIQKNRENTLTYLLTIQNLSRIFDEFMIDYSEDLTLDRLNEIEKLFVEKSEQVFLQENVKWKEIQRAKASNL